MADITLSKAVRSNLLNLQSTAALMGKTQERLATGLKVNSALDNATNFFTASSLNSRASDMGRLLDSVSNAIQTIAAADKGISALTKLVETAQATARQALQTPATVDTTTTTAATAGSVTGGAFSAMDFTVSAATAGTNTITFGSATAFDGNDDALTFDIAVDGGAAQSITIEAADVALVGNNDNTIDNADELVAILNTKITGATAANSSGTITITSDTTGASSSVVISNTAISDVDNSGFANNTGITDGAGTAGQAAGAAKTLSFDVAVDGGAATSVSIDLAAVQAVGNNDGIIDSVAELASIVDAQLGAGVTVDGSGATLVLTSATTGASSSVAISNTTATNVANSTGIADGSDTGSAATTTTTSGANPKRDELRTTYNELLGQIDQLVKDAGFNGVNLLDSDDLSVMFNEDGSSKLDIEGADLDSTGLGLSSLAANGFDTDAAINTTLDDLKAAIDTLRTQAGKFGANLSVVEIRQDFTKNMINVLETGAANLTLADTNEEAANLLALQTRQQLSSTALSLASQADQNVLRLF
jgi:flagellin-like hook-associated protein FlgL